MVKWEDIQAEVLRQDIAELEKSSTEAQGNQQEIQKRKIVNLKQQLAIAEKASDTSTSNTEVRRKAKGNQELDQLKQRFGGRTRQTDSERSQRGTQSEEIDEHAELLRITQEVLVCNMLSDKEGTKRALGYDVVEAKFQPLEKLAKILKVESSSNTRHPRTIRQNLKTVNDVLEYQKLLNYSLRLNQKVMWTIVTTPRAKLPAVTPGVRFKTAMEMPIAMLVGSWKMLSVWRHGRSASVKKRRLEFILDRHDRSR
ncbi:MAG: hypothetical protein Q9157_004873 [Trypethelium eluteriae]